MQNLNLVIELNQQNTLVFTVCKEKLPGVDKPQDIEMVEDVAIEIEVMLRTIINLKEQSTGGLDEITLRVIEELKNKMVKPLMIFF